MDIVALRLHAFNDFPRPRDFQLKGGDTRFLTFVGQVRARPAKGTGRFH
jgi:hypothetical protein